MEEQGNADNIKDLISDGKTEKAIEALVEHAKNISEEQYENAVLLSSQFRQWKRENMLGMEKTSFDLRRIELGVLNVLKGEDLVDQEIGALHKEKSSVQKMLPIIGGVLGVLALALVAWTMLGDKEATTEASPAITTPTDPAANETPTEAERVEFTAFGIAPGTELVQGEKYFSEDSVYYLILQEDDGNLCINYRSDDDFVWGSVQSLKMFLTSAKFLEDGDLLLHEKHGRRWSSETNDLDAQLSVSEEGDLMIVDGEGFLLWRAPKAEN